MNEARRMKERTFDTEYSKSNGIDVQQVNIWAKGAALYRCSALAVQGKKA